MTFEIKPNITNKESISGLSAIIGGLQQDQSNIQNTINTKQTKFNSPYKDWKVDVEGTVHVSFKDEAGYGNVPFYLTSCSTYDGINFQFSNTLPMSYYGLIESFAYGNGKYVAITFSGQVIYSQDLITWTLGTNFLNGQYGGWFHSCGTVYGNGVFYAQGSIGNNSYGVRSTDGLNWTASPLMQSSVLLIQFFKGKFIQITYFGTSFYSDDALTWTQGGQVAPYSGYGYFQQRPVFILNNKIMFISSDGIFGYSDDGISWQHQYLDLYSANMVFQNGLYVAKSSTGYIKTSSDLQNWSSAQNLPASMYGWILAGNNRFIALNNSQRTPMLSYDGQTWQSVAINKQSTNIRNFLFINNKFIIYTDMGAISSSNGINWTDINSNYDSSFSESFTSKNVSFSKTIGQILGI